jgi:hypothetical protein
MTSRLPDPAEFAGAFAYEHTDVPAELTLTAWRRGRHSARRRPLHNLARRLRAAVGARR